MGENGGLRLTYPPAQSIGFLSLFLITFSSVGSGPAGIEGIVGSSSILFAIVAILIFPFCWSYSQALISAELSLRFKDINGGSSAWALRLFGKKMAFIVSMAIVVVQCSTAAFVSETSVAYIETIDPSFNNYSKRLLLSVLIITASFLFNLVSINFVSKICGILTVNTLAAFLTLIVISIPKIDINRLHSNPVETYKTMNWSYFINLLVYNSAGYDAASSVIEYVKNPRSVVPKTIILTSVLIAVLYTSSLLIPYLAVRDSASEWQVGHFSTVALAVGGKRLQSWIITSCILTNAQIYFASLQTASYTMLSMAENSIMWKWLAYKTQRGTPYSALSLCAFISLLFATVPLKFNLSIEAVLSGFIMVFECLCLLSIDRKTLFAPQDTANRWFIIITPIILSSLAIAVQPHISLFLIFSSVVISLFIVLNADFDKKCKDEKNTAKR